jgi:DNA-binding NtrC family response regulator
MAKHPRTRAPKSDRSDVLAEGLRQREREIIADYLKRNEGNVGATANALGITRRALEMKMAAHGLRDAASALRVKAGIGGPR